MAYIIDSATGLNDWRPPEKREKPYKNARLVETKWRRLGDEWKTIKVWVTDDDPLTVFENEGSIIIDGSPDTPEYPIALVLYDDYVE